MEAPLLAVDDVVRRFALEHEMKVDENYHNMPNRRLLWRSNSVEKCIDVCVEDDQRMILYMGFIAWRDTDNKRYGIQGRVINNIPNVELEKVISLLEEGYRYLEPLTTADLQFIMNLEPSPY